RYLPFCKDDCDKVRAFGAIAPGPPVIRHEPPNPAFEGHELVLRATIASELPVVRAVVKTQDASIPLQHIDEDVWQAMILAPPRGAIEYLIRAENVLGAAGESKQFAVVVKPRPVAPVIEHRQT